MNAAILTSEDYDPYKGESLQKKIARFLVHSSTQDNLKAGLWIGGLHAFLASREGGDIGALTALGVPQSNLIAIDSNREALASCADKWGRGSIRYLHCSDAASEIARLGRAQEQSPIASVFLDFCSHLDKCTIEQSMAVWKLLPLGAILTVGFLKGREKAQSILRVPSAYPMNRQARRAFGNDDAASILCDRMIQGLDSWNVPRLLDLIRQTGTTDPGQCRFLLTVIALNRAALSEYPLPLMRLEYQSKTKTSNGVPMVVLQFKKERRTAANSEAVALKTLEKRIGTSLSTFKLTDEYATAARSMILDAPTAHLMLNVSQSTIAAWKAHKTRGTYAGSRLGPLDTVDKQCPTT